MNIREFGSENRANMVERISEKKKLQEMYLDEAVTLGDVSEAYENYRKLKNDPKASEEDIRRARSHMYYLSKKYKQYREGLGKKVETEVEKKIDQVIKESMLNEKEWKDIPDMSEEERREELEHLKKEMETVDDDKYPSTVYASFEKRIQDLEGSLGEYGPASLKLVEDSEDFIEEYFDSLETEEVSLLESREYSKYVRTHIKNVKTGYRWMKRYMPELFPKGFFNKENRTIRKTIRQHDKSKWGKSEYKAYDTYDDYRHGRKSKDSPEFADVKANFDKAWNHHQKSNPHHWQYWIITYGDGTNKVLDMPYENIIEMICDWWTFSWKENNLMSIFDWYAKNKNDMILSPKTRSKVEEILGKMKKKILELQQGEKKTLKEEALMTIFNEEKGSNFDYCYGVPSQKKYPLYDEKHVRSAIRLFGHVEPRFEKDLARSIIAKMRKYNIPFSVVGEDNRLRNYLPKNVLTESINYDEFFDEDITDEEYELLEMCALYENLSDILNTNIIQESTQNIMNAAGDAVKGAGTAAKGLGERIIGGLKKVGGHIVNGAKKIGSAIGKGVRTAVKAVGGPGPAGAIAGAAGVAAIGGAMAIKAAIKRRKKKKEEDKKYVGLTENVYEVLDMLGDDVLDLLEDRELVAKYYDRKNEHELTESAGYDYSKAGVGYFGLKKFSISKYSEGEEFGQDKEWKKIKPIKLSSGELMEIKELLTDLRNSNKSIPVDLVLSKIKSLYLIAKDTLGNGGYCIGTLDGEVIARYDLENWYFEINKDFLGETKQQLTEAVTFVDNAGQVKTMSAEDYVKDMHEYHTETQISMYKPKKIKDYKLLSEDELLEAHRDDPEVVELTKEIRDDAQELENLGINTNNMVNKDELDRLCDENLLEGFSLVTKDQDKRLTEIEKELAEVQKGLKEAISKSDSRNYRLLAKRNNALVKEYRKISKKAIARVSDKELIKNDLKFVITEVLSHHFKNDVDPGETITIDSIYSIRQGESTISYGCIHTKKLNLTYQLRGGSFSLLKFAPNEYKEICKYCFKNTKADGILTGEFEFKYNTVLTEHVSGNMSIEEVAKKHGVSVEELEKQVEMGIEVEHEHTSDDEEAKRIALDHLYEFPDYYTRLDKMEEEGEAALDESFILHAIDKNKILSAVKIGNLSLKDIISLAKKENTYDANLKKLVDDIIIKITSGGPAPEKKASRFMTTHTYSDYSLAFSKEQLDELVHKYCKEELDQIKSNYLDNILRESVLDPIQKERCSDIFDKDEHMKPEVRKYILDVFNNWKGKTPEATFNVKHILIIGSSMGFQYTDVSDIDVTVVAPDYTDDMWEKIKETIPNGNNLPDTNHPVNFFIRPDDHLESSENCYDLTNDKWLIKGEKGVNELPLGYITEVAKFFMNSFDLTFAEYERDMNDYKRIKALDPNKVEISEEEKAEELSKKLVEIKSALDSLRLGKKILHGFKDEVFEKGADPFEIHIEVKANTNVKAQYSPNNLIYKTLEQYGYRDRLDATIKEAEEFLENNDLEEDLHESLEAWLEDDSEILFEDFYKRYSKKANVRKVVKRNDIWNPNQYYYTAGALPYAFYSLFSKKRLDKKAAEVSNDPEVISTKAKLEQLVSQKADKKVVKSAYKSFEQACVKAQYRKKEKVKKE